MKVPHSYLTTSFSGPARAQRARLRNLFAGERRRGVLPLLAVFLSAALLGGLVSCRPAASDEPRVPAATPTPIVWGEQVQSTILTYESEQDQNTSTPQGVEIGLRFRTPRIENAAGNGMWEFLNSVFLNQGLVWLEKGREYWGTPGLESGGDYRVEVDYTIKRCDDLLSIRYRRTEHLVSNAVTVSGGTYSMADAVILSLADLLDGEVEDWLPALLDEAARANGSFGRDYYGGYFDVNAFYLTGDSLVLLFPVYADGAPIPTSTAECPIPLANLEDIASDRLRPSTLVTPAPPVATGTPAFSIAVPDALLDNVPPVALRAAQEQCLPGGAYYETFAASADRGASPIFDRAELLFLREDWTYDRLDAVPNTDPAAIKIYSFGARFHTTTPDRVSPAGSPKLTDNGWYTPSYEGAHRLIFEERDGVLTYKTYLMVNDSSPGDPLFTADALRALRDDTAPLPPGPPVEDCAAMAQPVPSHMKLTAFSRVLCADAAPRLDGVTMDVWYMAWQDHTGSIGLASANYFIYCFHFTDAEGSTLLFQAKQVTGDALFEDGAAMWEAYTAS